MQAHLIIIGLVQGIGYRQFVKSHAKKLNVGGWVKNLPDSSVEALLQGNKKSIEELVSLCKKGPFLAEVTDVHITWEKELTQYTSFSILQ
ncbi:MAG TPA: acylphosphatase [Candidatus Saccharimonadales bacterium]|nr:acylphosphatase [Candidatus Saccharimonadales bacterium]